MLKLPLIHRRLSRDYADTSSRSAPGTRRLLKRARTRIERRAGRASLRDAEGAP